MTPLEYDRARIWHPYASLNNPPPVLHAKAASGVEIELADGSRLVDAVSSWWCVGWNASAQDVVWQGRPALAARPRRPCHIVWARL